MMCGRAASVEALTQLTCLTLQRDRFVEILGPLEQIMAREKSPQVRNMSRPAAHALVPVSHHLCN